MKTGSRIGAAIPRRVSLPEQTAAALREWIGQGEFGDRLPGEIELAALMQVGRNTMRTALAALETEGLLKTTNGLRREIVRRPPRRRRGCRHAILVVAKPQGGWSPSTAQWIDRVKARLENKGWHFQVLVEPGAYRRSPTPLLKSLTASWPDAVWILHHSTPAMQRWFQDQRKRAILAGSRHEGIRLPRLDLDARAVSRHAAGRFLARGHRRLAVLRLDAPLAGDAESVAAFREGAGTASVADVRCRGGAAGVAAALRGLLRAPEPPTALYVLHTELCIAALTFLQQQGVAVPGQVSLICRDDEAYLGWLCPEPARYRRDSALFAAKLAALVERCGSGAAVSPPTQGGLIMPSSIAGATLASASVLKKNR